MNLFRFLKSSRGAIKPLNALVISGAAGVVFAYTVNTAANKQIQAERSVRSLSSISQTAPQQGMLRHGNLLTSINVRDGRNQLATAQERAAMEGNTALDRYNANQRALGSFDESFGRAAQFSDSDGGLNTGNREAVQGPVRLSVGNPNTPVSVPPSSQNPDATSGASAPQPQTQRLAPASIARASGSPSGSTSGGISGSASGGRGAQQGAEGPRRLSGAMPEGSNIVSRRGLDGALAGGRNVSAFGRDRDGRLGRGRNGKGERNELKDIVKRSADAAGNINASANEGGRAFLANSRNSGGVSVDGGEDLTRGASSGDLAAPTERKLKAVGNKLNEVDDELEGRNAEHRALIWQLVATALGSIGMMVAGSLILSKLDKKINELLMKAAYAASHFDTVGAEGFLAAAAVLKVKRWAIAAAMLASVVAANAWLFFRAKKFISNYGSAGGTAIAVISEIVAPLLVVGMVQTVLKPSWKDFIKSLWGKIKGRFDPVDILTNTSTDAISKL